MAPRTSATFAKRQKERARQEKQQAKQERKLQRKLEKRETTPATAAGELDSIAEIASHPEPRSDHAAAGAETTATERESQ